MNRSRLWFPIAVAGLVVGLENGCSKGQAATGPDPSTRPPPHGDNGRGDKPGHPHPFVARPEFRIASADAARRTKFIALLESPGLGLLDESEAGRQRDGEKATETLKKTFDDLPNHLAAAFGPEAGKQLWSGVEPGPIRCVYSGCYADVAYPSWQSFDAVNQLVDKDRTLAWNGYPETRYRSGRTSVTGDRFEVTWALVFPLRSIEDDQADVAKTTKKLKKGARL